MRHFSKQISVISVMMLVGILFPPSTYTVADAQHMDAIEAIFHKYDFPALPNLTHLCQQRVYMAGKGTMHLTWDAFASEAAPSLLVEYYQKCLGKDGFSPETDGGTWRFPEEKPERVLSIVPVQADGPHWSCDRKPPENTRSIIIISTTQEVF